MFFVFLLVQLETQYDDTVNVQKQTGRDSVKVSKPVEFIKKNQKKPTKLLV